MEKTLYSIRMHSTRYEAHLSGAERLVPAEAVERIASELVQRALCHPRGTADQIRLTVDAVAAETIRRATLPAVTTVQVGDVAQGRAAAQFYLEEAGVSPQAAAAAISTLSEGAAPGGRSMRGAMLVDAATGARLERDPARGVRVSRMDLGPEVEEAVRRDLQQRGLDNSHVREALVLAGKVLGAPEVVAELCWSDDPDYTAGYIAARRLGYMRFPHLKPRGEERGGRAFFLRSGEVDLDGVIRYLEQEPVLFTNAAKIQPDVRWTPI